MRGIFLQKWWDLARLSVMFVFFFIAGDEYESLSDP